MDNSLKKHFITADWHAGHESILKFAQRPFRDLGHMHEVLINNFNSTVPPDGITYFAGDMGMCSQDLLSSIVAQLHGTKILILGNHDKNMNAMYRAGFDLVLYGVILYIANQQVTVSHCPLKDTYREDTSGMRGGEAFPNWWGETRLKFQRFIVPNWGQFHLHGHTHARKGRKESNIIEGRQRDIGVDATGFKPLAFAKIESWIAKTAQKEKVSDENE